MADIWHQLGQASTLQGKASEAEKNYREALRTYLALGDQREIATVYQNFGYFLRQHERYEEAEACYSNALSIHQEVGNEHGVAMVYRSLGNVALAQRRYADAESMYSAGLSASIKSGNRLDEASAYQNLGMVARDQQSYDKAEASTVGLWTSVSSLTTDRWPLSSRHAAWDPTRQAWTSRRGGAHAHKSRGDLPYRQRRMGYRRHAMASPRTVHPWPIRLLARH